MQKAYEPKDTEKKWYDYWENNGLFHASDHSENGRYCIVIPPPNVTGALHMGHALNHTLQDILIRWRRMVGDDTLWQPGTDHAGIATQNVVERELLKTEGKKRHELGREALIKKIWEWREKYGDKILEQLKSLGASCDWERTRFTLDEGLSRAVREAFVGLYDKGLIYRGKYIVNWCPRCHTALADDEVDHEDEPGHLWHIRYPLADEPGHIIVATTRPETLLGDTAVAVNPKDERYSNLIGKMVKLPETNRQIPIVADDFVDASFGTGAVKVTPAHDPNDFQIGTRHNLPLINIMDEEAVLNEEAGEKYQGMSRDECRKKIVAELTAQNLIEKIEDHAHAVGHCYRCKTTIEPWLSDQWFVRMRPLAEKAIRATEEGKVNFHPKRWTQFYMQWLENARDWCISRQIWWGHRIPVWYCDTSNQKPGSPESQNHCPPIVSRETPTRCPHCGGTKLKQDEDVLDTWFSSALWPFSTLGWPDKTGLLKNYYPTSTLVTDRGIIYFWVARMVMMGLELLNEVPFKDVYIHGTILDEQGRKMSKSLGNGIDPLEIIGKYGADAMRFSLVLLSTEGQDLKLSESKFEMGRNFCNKLWNATRFAMMNLEGAPKHFDESKMTFADKWIKNRLAKTISEITDALEDFKFNTAAQALYQFVWNDFCDWYLEAAKLAMREDEDASVKAASQFTLKETITTITKLLHPFLPFITEELWHHLEPETGSIMKARFPQKTESIPYEAEAAAFELAKEIVSAIRNIRGEHNVKPSQKIKAVLKFSSQKQEEAINNSRAYIMHLAKLETLDAGKDIIVPKQAATALAGELEIHIPYEGLIDLKAERQRLQKEIGKAENDFLGLERKLSNEEFISKAPKEIVDRENERMLASRAAIAALKEALRKLG